MTTAFGSQWTSKWAAVGDINTVYEDWAEDLASMSLGAIKWAIVQCRKDGHPPNVGEFVNRCKQYKPADAPLKLERKFTEEEMEINRARIAKIKADLAAGMSMHKGLKASAQ